MQRIERLQVTNHERWGKLVKTWATGTNYLDVTGEIAVFEALAARDAEAGARAGGVAGERRSHGRSTPQSDTASRRRRRR